jgi:hypothetical protein
MRFDAATARRGVPRTIVLCGLLMLPVADLGLAQVTGDGGRNEALRRELLGMEQDDQKHRKEAAELEDAPLPPDEKKKRRAALMEVQADVDKRNMQRLAQIIERYGWPGKSLVGKEASLAAWLILQHSELEDQTKYVPRLKEAVRAGEAEPAHAAYLEDRMLMRQGRKQIYGTQLHRSETSQKLELWPVEDEEHLDARRASLGLEPIAEYLKRFGLEYATAKK